jgi:hypothetical protein
MASRCLLPAAVFLSVYFSGCGGTVGKPPAPLPGPGQLAANQSEITFGNVAVGSKATQTVVLTNTGAASVTISKLNTSGPGFNSAGPALPVTLPAGQSTSLTVVFLPDSSGGETGALSVVSTAMDSPVTIALSGAGVEPSQSPTIVTQPASQTILAGQTATFSVAASGTPPLSYQWQMNGAAISGATAASYTTPAETIAGNGEQFTVDVKSNAGSITSNAATLTVNAATSQLSASPASLDYGNVVAGSESTQRVLLTNTGNSNVTLSQISATGDGFSASGAGAGTVIAPGQSLALVVAYSPSSPGSSSGTLSIASNASNSPATTDLEGTGFTPATGSLACGLFGDSSDHVPLDWTTFAPPAKGHSYVDPTFGCTVTRITDVSSEDLGGTYYLPISHGYATFSPFNADDTYLMLVDGYGRRLVTDLAGNSVVPVANMPSGNDGWYLWDAKNPSVFYYTAGNTMMQGSISGSSVATTVVHQFTEYPAINFMDETDVSQDGQHVVVVGGDTTGKSPENVFVYDFVTNTKGPMYATTCTGSVGGPNNGCLHKVIQTADNNVIIQFADDGVLAEQGNRLWTGLLNLSGLPVLTAVQDTTNHLDSGYDLNGNPIFVEVGNASVLSTLPGITNPCPSGWGLDVRMLYSLLSAACLLDQVPQYHVGYRGNAKQPWVGLSFFDNRSPSPEWFDNSGQFVAPTENNWLLYEDEIVIVRVDANNDSSLVYRLARAYSRSNEDFNAQPKAAISRDGKYIAFDSNMAYAHTGCPANFQNGTDCADVYVIRVQ